MFFGKREKEGKADETRGVLQ